MTEVDCVTFILIPKLKTKQNKTDASQVKHILAEIGSTVHECVTFGALMMPFLKKKNLFWQIISFCLVRTQVCFLCSVLEILGTKTPTLQMRKLSLEWRQGGPGFCRKV